MKLKSIIPLALGLVIGVFAIRQTMTLIRNAEGTSKEVQSVPVVMAREDIPAMAEIMPEMLRMVETPMTPLLPRDAFTEAVQLAGRVTAKAIPAGVPVLPTMLAEAGTEGGVPGRVPEGFRAVSVKIDEATGVAYLVNPDDWVDVLAVMDQKRNGKRETVSKTILQRVQVVAIGQALNGNAEEPGSRRAQTATLLVKVQDVPKLHMAQTRGRITLALRGQDDTVIADLHEEEDEPKEKDVDAQLAAATAPAVLPVLAPEKEKTTVTIYNDSDMDENREPMRVTFEHDESLIIIHTDRGAAPSAAAMLLDGGNHPNARKPNGLLDAGLDHNRSPSTDMMSRSEAGE